MNDCAIQDGIPTVLDPAACENSDANCNLDDAAIVSLLETVLYNNRQE